MKKKCPICMKNEYTISIRIMRAIRAYPVLNVMCDKCGYEYWSFGSMLLSLLLVLILSCSSPILFLIVFHPSAIIFIIFVILLILCDLGLAFVSEYLFIPFLPYKKIHKQHCFRHELLSSILKDNKIREI